MEWPQAITENALYDSSLGQPSMEYNLTLDFNNTSDPEHGTFYLDVPGENTTFTRCYIFDFWIPLYINSPDNPSRLEITDGLEKLTINLTAKHYIYDDTGMIIDEKTVKTDADVKLVISDGTIMRKIRTSIIN